MDWQPLRIGFNYLLKIMFCRNFIFAWMSAKTHLRVSSKQMAEKDMFRYYSNHCFSKILTRNFNRIQYCTLSLRQVIFECVFIFYLMEKEIVKKSKLCNIFFLRKQFVHAMLYVRKTAYLVCLIIDRYTSVTMLVLMYFVYIRLFVLHYIFF